ncbi:MAG: cytochrome [Holophagaceae bacterium]|nr:cytochrome [Holophagaceae bacterium]
MFNKAKRSFYLLLLPFLIAATFMSASSKDSAMLADRHKVNGVNCEDCHLTKKPTTAAKIDKCLECHEGYEGMAKRTAKKEKGPHVYLANINPHDSHIGKIECSECHSAHSEPHKSFCDRCHTFDFDSKKKKR